MYIYLYIVHFVTRRFVVSPSPSTQVLVQSHTFAITFPDYYFHSTLYQLLTVEAVIKQHKAQFKKQNKMD
jgi:hypothetical protein